ncbi:MAG: hypothetical protein M1840_003612 [Geoglossum simile]|nr:MAG: hypothetical protein M1840_003612 [Geoglossum simile]
MPRKRSARTAEIKSKVEKAIDAFKSGKVKSPYAAAKLFGLATKTVTYRLNRSLNCSQSHMYQEMDAQCDIN